jgi:signal transduction histidine kinase
MADDAIREIRTISHLLHPPLLDEAGLNSAMRWFVEGFAKRSGIQVNLQVPDSTLRYDDSVELVLFRVLQEGLTNVHRHSGAKHADVTLSADNARVTLMIRDSGKGIPPDVLLSVTEDAIGRGVGLAGMTERVRELGGRFEIKSSAKGTEILAEVPVRPRTAMPTELLPNPVQEVSG